MRTTSKILAVLGVGVAASLAGTAATGNGFTNSAGSTQFIGGTVSTTVTGATLSSIAYHGTDATNTTIDHFTLTFSSATPDGKTVALVTNVGSGSADTYTCEAIGHTTTHVSTCTMDNSGSSNISSLDITVS